MTMMRMPVEYTIKIKEKTIACLLGPWGLPPPDPRTGKNGTAVGPERPSARPTAVRRPSDDHPKPVR